MTHSPPGQRVFVTGGAGFIGSRLVRKLQAAKLVTVFDSLHSQVHGPQADFPIFADNVVCIRGDVCDADALSTAVKQADPDLIIHLAAETGTGQSLDEVQRYCDVNVMGTANLLASIDRLPKRSRRFLLSSSRSVYGEGPYRRADGSIIYPGLRRLDALRHGDFELRDSDGERLTAAPTGPGTPVQPLSVYASTKLFQEHLLLNCSEAKGLEPRILRFQNVYGPGQSLRNPYTGVLSIFSQQVIDGRTLDIFEDGAMLRDFVFVDDVVSACLAALAAEGSFRQPIDIGSGEPTTILAAARMLIGFLGGHNDNYRITGNFRVGDIKSAFADIAPAQQILQWAPATSLSEGLRALANWAAESNQRLPPAGT